MAAVRSTFVCVLLLCLAEQALSIPLSLFYPFGENVSDSILGPNDDGSSPQIDLEAGFFPYFGATHTSLYVSG